MPSVSQRLRERAAIIPGVIAVIVVAVWGIDLAIKDELSWGQAVWLVASAGLIGIASLLAVLPMTFALDWLAVRTRFEIRLWLYVASFALLGLALAIATGGLRPYVALLGGGLAGALLAKLSTAGSTASPHRGPK